MRGTVSGKELRSVFIDMASLFKKYDRAKAVGISTTHNSITFTLDTGTCYTRTIDMKPVSDVINMELTILFADLAHFIPVKTDVLIELSEYHAIIVSGKTKLSLQVGESIVTSYVPRKGTVVDLDYGALKKAAKIFMSTQDLQKAYRKDFSVNFYGEWALMKAPTVWIRTRSQGLKCILSLEQLRSIVTYQPEFVEESDRLEFHKGQAILSVPRITPTDSDNFKPLIAGMPHISTVNMEGVVKELLEIKRSVGIVDAEIHLHQEGFNIKVSRGGISLEETYNVTGSSVYSFRYQLDLFTMALNLLGEDTEIRIYAKEGLICLESTETSILLSV